MVRKTLLGTALVLMAGCASVENETYSTILVNGRETDLRSRTVVEGDRTYISHAVRSRSGSFKTCEPDRPGSCEQAARSNAGGKDS